MFNVTPRWRFFGEALHLQPTKLDVIEKCNPKSPEECLSDTLKEFLKMNYNTKEFGAPSWKMIVKAIGCKAGGNNTNMAQIIAKDHPDTTNGIILNVKKLIIEVILTAIWEYTAWKHNIIIIISAHNLIQTWSA